MALGIVEPKTASSPPGTELLVDDRQTDAEKTEGHPHFKHAGKVGDLLEI